MVLLARGDYASVEFKRLKSRVSKGDTVLDSVVGECETFISGVVVNGMNSYNTFYQAYCSYAVALGISYVRNTGTTMYVSLEENEHRLNIDAVSVINLTNSEYEILFILAHEVKHLLLRHLLKYKYMFSDEVARVFLNMATDVEVNEGLKSDICGRFGSEADCREKYIPAGCYDIDSACKTLRVPKSQLLEGYRRSGVTLSSYLYSLYDRKCKKVLGHGVSDILYRIKLAKVTSFSEEVFKIADGGVSSIFDINDNDRDEAQRFCKDIAQYLDRTITIIIGIDTSDKDVYSYIEDTLDNIEEFQGCIMSKVFMNSKGRSGDGCGSEVEIDAVEMKPMVPWESMLNKYLNTMSMHKERCKKRINRRNPDRLELSGKNHKKCLSLVVAVDDSGSFSNEECVYAMSEIASIVSKFECELILYRFTSRVEFCERYDFRRAKRELGKVTPKIKRYSGGTSFQPVFDAINNDKKFKRQDTVVVIITDGMGEGCVNFGKVSKRIWVVTGGRKKISCPEKSDNIFPVVLT